MHPINRGCPTCEGTLKARPDPLGVAVDCRLWPTAWSKGLRSRVAGGHFFFRFASSFGPKRAENFHWTQTPSRSYDDVSHLEPRKALTQLDDLELRVRAIRGRALEKLHEFPVAGRVLNVSMRSITRFCDKGHKILAMPTWLWRPPDGSFSQWAPRPRLIEAQRKGKRAMPWREMPRGLPCRRVAAGLAGATSSGLPD